ncbi:hypothetical protein CRYUN_Cryun19dG0091200 [Craigia yunnanensis]
MEEIGAGKIERIATQNSIRSLLSGSLKSDSEPLHLLLSTYLTINLGQSSNFKRAYGIHQWWDPSFDDYVLERDRQKNRQGPQAYAPPSWESFNFQLNHLLIDDVDQSIFGAIYEFNPSARNSTPEIAPNYVIAFRGTLNTPAFISRDLKLDLLCICNRLHVSSRFQLATKFVEDIAATATANGSNIWLAGHSPGSASALLAGKNLTKLGCLVETYLFNPPFLSAPVEILKHRVLKNGIPFTSSVVNAALTTAIKGRHPNPEDDPFTASSSWTPYLFVLPSDLICSEYKGYFEHRKKMEEIGAGKI